MKNLMEPNWKWDGVSVDITNKTQADPYIVPCDGFLVIISPAGVKTMCSTDDTAIPFVVIGSSSESNYGSYFVKKGMKLYTAVKQTGSSATFRGLKTY